MMTPKKTLCRAIGPDVQVVIEGHLDTMLTAASALFLSQRLAEAAEEALKNQKAPTNMGLKGAEAHFKVVDKFGNTTYIK